MHHLTTVQDRLSTLKVECLKPFRESITVKYKTALGHFVQWILGRPMEKLSTFFEEVERLIESGTAAQEVGFKMDFSKSKLRKVLAPTRHPPRRVPLLYISAFSLLVLPRAYITCTCVCVWWRSGHCALPRQRSAKRARCHVQESRSPFIGRCVPP
jgi:hypothetical protein